MANEFARFYSTIGTKLASKIKGSNTTIENYIKKDTKKHQ